MKNLKIFNYSNNLLKRKYKDFREFKIDSKLYWDGEKEHDWY